jgi:hypothetical protein
MPGVDRELHELWDKHSSISILPIMPSYYGGTLDGCF